MPYYISDSAPGCDGWATVKDDGEVMGCHTSKQAAINQALAIAQAEGSTFEGERGLRALPDNYRPAVSADVPEGRACGNCVFYNEDRVNDDGVQVWCERWDDWVRGDFYCNAWRGDEDSAKHYNKQKKRVAPDAVDVGDYVSWNSAGGRAQGRITRIVRSGTLDVPETDFTLNADGENPAALIRVYERVRDGWEPRSPLVGHRFATLTKIEPLPEPSPEQDSRDVDLTVPAYIRQAAAQGLEYHREGLSGAGVVERTIREATAMARGEVSEDKVVRAAAWAARHRPDLDAQGARPDEDGYPTPGAVAHLLWGIPTGGRYSDAVAWFDRKAAQVKDDRSIGMEVTPVSPRTKGSEVEFRSFTGELRAEGDGNTFVGYAAVFNSPSEPLPFIERIAPGAFSKSLRSRKQDIKLYVNHNSDMLLASRRSGTLRLSEDERGLRVEADLPDTTAGRDIRELMRSGIVDKMSFGFQVDRKGDRWSDDGSERVLTSVRLFEVSVVTGFPAYEATTAAVRSLSALSVRTGMAVDDLSDTLEALAAGEDVDAEKVAALAQIVNGAMPQPEPEPVSLLGLKQKNMDLLAKKW
jgi:HK97 family phage prohead protease